MTSGEYLCVFISSILSKGGASEKPGAVHDLSEAVSATGKASLVQTMFSHGRLYLKSGSKVILPQGVENLFDALDMNSLNLELVDGMGVVAVYWGSTKVGTLNADGSIAFIVALPTTRGKAPIILLACLMLLGAGLFGGHSLARKR